MEITHLKLDDMYIALANGCFAFDGQQEGQCIADALDLGCPFGASEEEESVRCKDIKPEHWREVFEGKEDQKPEPLPEFQFGDRVTVQLGSPTEGIFNMYVDDHGIIRASVLFEGSECCEEVAVADLKAGWQ